MNRKIKSVIIGTFVTCFWLFMVGWLAKDYLLRKKEAPPVELNPYDLTLKWKDKEQWMEILYNNKSVGVYFLEIKHDTEANEFKVINRISMGLTMIGTRIPISIDSVIFLRDDFILKEFIVSLNALVKKMKIYGMTQGNELLIRWYDGTQETFTSIDLPNQVSLYNAITPVIVNNGKLKVGSSFKIPAYDPMWESLAGDLIFHVVAEETIMYDDKEFKAYKVESVMNNMKTTSWILPNGEVLKQQLPYGITLARTNKVHGLKLAPELLNDITYKRVSPKDFKSRTHDILKLTGETYSDDNTTATLPGSIPSLTTSAKNPSAFFSLFGAFLGEKK